MKNINSIARQMAIRVPQVAGLVLLAGVLNLPAPVVQAATVPQLSISQTPLSVTEPVHPQVLIALGNSESMDGDLSGAIMTGSGSLASTYDSLQNSSSPADYTIPSGFDPSQLGLGGSGCTAPAVASSATTYPYSYECGNVVYDVSASRLNVAKESIYDIMDEYFTSTDFGLMTYDETSVQKYTTWVYYMSGDNGFSFTDSAPSSGEYVVNPCYGYTSLSALSQVYRDCAQIAYSGLYSQSSVNDQYLVVGASSDDADINDVLYASGDTSVTVSYGGPRPSDPYTYYGISQYNNGGITTTYSNGVPYFVTQTSPTNAGYIPYSPQVMYAMRGFGYGASDAKTGGSGKIVAKDSNGDSIISAGQSPTSASVSTALGYFSSALNAETSKASTSEIKALAGQSPLAGLMKSALSTLQNASAPSYDCANPKQYVVLITDGLPTEDLSGKFWPPLGTAAATGYGVTASFNSDGSLNTSGTNDQALIDTISEITALNNAGIETYVVGLGAGVDATANPSAAAALKAMAVAGGTSSASSDGYFPATSPAALVSDLASILNNVASQNSSSSSAATNSAALTTGSDLYQATFNPGSSTTDAWTGDLEEYAVDTSGNISTTATWSAQAQLDQQGTDRYIATWDPDHVPSGGTTVVPSGVPFEWADLSTTLQNELQPSDTDGQLRLNYLRGDHSEEQVNGGPFRTRQHLLGDIVDSSPVYVGTPSAYYPDASYQTFVTEYENRTPMLYVGANDGMLHGFNANTGAEAMAFIPNGVFANLYKLTDPYYLYNHHFFVDGSPVAGDVLLSDGHWHTLLVGGEDGGGNSIYAIDVTNPASYTSDAAVASDVKWEFTDADMGYSYSAPVIVRSNAVTVTDASDDTQVNGFAVLFGNGYNSPSGQPIFYALDASTGSVIAKIDLCTAAGVPTTACSDSAPNGLSSITAANSSGVGGVPQDMAYAGDLQGNLWAINMSSSNPADWTVKLLFQARDSSGNDQPITTAPVVTLNPHFPGANGESYLGLMVYFGTGMFLQTSDLTSTATQSYYGVWDNTADLSNYPASSTPTMPYSRSNLQQQTISLGTYTSSSGTTTPAILSTDNAVNLTYAPETVTNPSPPPATLTVPPVEGWYFDLSPLTSTGQPAARVFTNSVIDDGGVGFTVNVPPASSSTSCGTPSSYFMYVAYATGGPFSQPSIGFGGGISISSSETVNGQNPTGELIGNGYNSAPTILRDANGYFNVFSGTGPAAGASLGQGSGSSGGSGSGGGNSSGLGGGQSGGPQSGRVGWWQVQ